MKEEYKLELTPCCGSKKHQEDWDENTYEKYYMCGECYEEFNNLIDKEEYEDSINGNSND